MNNVMLEIESRKWYEWDDTEMEDEVTGEWIYVPVKELIKRISACGYVQLEEKEGGITLVDLIFSNPNDCNPHYILAGRRPYWLSNESELLDFEVVRKALSIKESSGIERKFGRPAYPDYASFGLMTPDEKVLSETDLLNSAGIFTALKLAVTECIKNRGS